jgi:hypothetical protein
MRWLSVAMIINNTLRRRPPLAAQNEGLSPLSRIFWPGQRFERACDVPDVSFAAEHLPQPVKVTHSGQNW